MPAADLSELENSLGYRFSDRGLLVEALTHKSYHHERPDQAPAFNERLEFLGDSVLGLVVVEYLFRSGEAHRESTMSKIKAHIVRGAALSEAARSLSLGGYLRLGRGEVETGGRQKPSILANALEAVMGAVYLDGGYEEARRLILALFKGKLDHAVSVGQLEDYKTSLQEESQTRFGVLPEYRLVSEEGREHDKVFTMEVLISGVRHGLGTGRTKKKAEAEAAREALKKLGERA